ncbi:hypothetical protein [Halocatena marina]|uniref:Uncharacterized protein n=1 Tax=Halocatena marina TaxID=2934937 RepID=A0ABD5YUW3_9EURY|nr:hypothetical protein [Halocatena marina]
MSEPVSQRCELPTAADLLTALEKRGFEYLDVDDHRTFVLYSEAVLDLQVTEGTLTAARTCTVTSQGFALWVNDPDPDAVVADFCTELVAAADTDRC